MTAFNSRELRFLRVVAAEDRRHYWHSIETRLAGVEPFKPSAVELGRRLEALDVMRLLAIDEIAPRYCMTDHGREALAEIDRNGWLLGPAEAFDYVGQLSGTIEQRITVLAPFLEAPALFEKVILQLRAAGLSLALVAWTVQLVVRENRSAVAFAFVTDPDPAIRTALFLAWGGPGEGAEEQARFKPPGESFDWATDSMFVDLLTVGLNDPSPTVRDAAARLAYLTQSGVHVTSELVANLASPTPSRWAAAALGTATDAPSLEVLARLFHQQTSDELAGGAVRAFAARCDARRFLYTALRDHRKHVRWNAVTSLGLITTGLTDNELAEIERIDDDEIRTALAYYHSRNPSR